MADRYALGALGMKAGFSRTGLEPSTRNFAFLLGWIGLLVTIAFYIWEGGWLDLKVYTNAVAIHEHGGDPYSYRNALGLIFVYSPLVLRFFALFDGYLGPVLVVCYIGVLLLLLRAEMRPVAIGIVVAAAGMIFVRNRFCQAVNCGNVAVFLHLTLIFLWLRYGRHGNVALFYIAVFAAAIIKPHYLGYAVVPILCGAPLVPALIRGGSATLGTAAVWLAQLWLWPDAYRRMSFALTDQLSHTAGHDFSGDNGFGFYHLGAFVFGDSYAAMAVSAVAAAGVVAIWYVVNRRNAVRADSGVMASLSALAVAILVNPRLKVYDDGIMTALLFGYFYLATDKLSGRQAKWVFWVFVAAGCILCNFKTFVRSNLTYLLADGFLVYYPVFVITTLAWLACRQAESTLRPA